MKYSSLPLAFLSAGMSVMTLSGCPGTTNGGGGGDDDDDTTPDACACPMTYDDGGVVPGGDGGAPMGCADPGAAVAQPFGSHAVPYAAGTILPNHVAQADLDDAVRSFYATWKSRYLEAGCGDGRYYVRTGQASSQTVSEAHGYGMLILAYLAGEDPEARTIFDGMFRYFADHQSETTPGLMAWSQDDSCANNQGANSASDGDLDIAFALLLADKQWGSGGAIDYRAEAARVMNAALAGDVDDTASWVLLGDWTAPGDSLYETTRTSDFMPGHFASFAAASGDARWSALATREYAMVAALQAGYSPGTGLLPDFVQSPGASPSPVSGTLLENPTDGDYAYNACRDPWRIATDFLTNGDGRAHAAVQKMNDWIKDATGGDPGNIRPGYQLDGGNLAGSYLDLSFVAPFGVSAMVDAANQGWLNSVWDTVVGTDEPGYYQDTIKLLAMIAMSGNWWTPEAASCP